MHVVSSKTIIQYVGGPRIRLLLAVTVVLTNNLFSSSHLQIQIVLYGTSFDDIELFLST